MSIPEHIEQIYRSAKCLFTSHEIEAALDNMAHEIQGVLCDKNPLVLCVMLGGLVPLGRLLLRLDFPLELDYIHATRYRGETQGGDIEWRSMPSSALRDRTLLIVDDILDGGITLTAILEHCREQGAKEVYTAVLVDKKDKRLPRGLPKADFTGLTIEDHYIFGYGMDYKEYLRNAPGIYIVDPTLLT